jgi:two-component sensor histidine kinase
MSRTSYPIFRDLWVVIVAMGVSTTPVFARQGTTRYIASGFFNSPVFLLLILSSVICFSIVYRKWMYNRLLAGKKELETLPPKTTLKAQMTPIDGILDQVVLDKEQENIKTHIQVVHNLLHFINLVQQQPSFFRGDMVNSSLKEASQRLFTLSLIHAKLYHKGQQEMVDLHELVPILIDNYTSTAGNDCMIRFIYSSTSRNIELPVNQVVPMTFFINEVLNSFGSIKSENYFSETVGVYLQETKGLVKLTVRTEGLNVLADFITLKRNLHQQVHKYFPESLSPHLSIDQALGTSIHLQFQKQTSKLSVIF